jgi:hypothetical protein
MAQGMAPGMAQGMARGRGAFSFLEVEDSFVTEDPASAQ